METSERLASMSFFQLIPEGERVRLALQFERQFAKRGEVIFSQGDLADAFYVVDRGLLRARAVAQEKEVPRAYFYPGDYFGETGLLKDQPRNATVEVLEDCELFVLPKTDFGLMVEQFPLVRHKLLEVGRLREEAGRQRFPWQEPDEATLSVQTKHWIALLRASRSVYALLVLFVILLPTYFSSSLTSLGHVLVTLVSGALLGLIPLLIIYRVLDWRNDQYIVTNKRVLHIERVFLVREERHEAPIDQVQDIKVKRGVLANLLGYGRIMIQTAGPTGRINFAYTPYPDIVRDAILAPKQQAETHVRAEEREAIRQELEQRLGVKGALPEETQAAEPATKKPPQSEAPVWLQRLGKPLQQAWQGLKGRISFQTRIVTDGGDTITWRKNVWVLAQASLLPVTAISVLVVMFFFLLFARLDPFSGRFALIPLGLLPFAFAWWVYVYWDWQNDIYQISGNRLLDLKKRPLFLAEDRRETTLDRVENIKSDVPGPIAKILNYGTVTIETAGEEGAFVFHHIHAPIEVHEEIFSRLERYRRQKEERERQRRRAEMSQWFEIYDKIKQEQRQAEGKTAGQEAEPD